MTAKTTLVSTGAELLRAARAARSGDTILLAGVNFGEVSLANLSPTGLVTIKSADPLNNAVFETLKIGKLTNFVFEDFDVVHALKPNEASYSPASTINNSSNITLVNIDFSGSMNGNPNDDGPGLKVLNSSKIMVLDSTFQQFAGAVGFSRSSDVVFAGNTVMDSRDGVVVGAVAGGLFERNFVTGIRGDLSRGEHADAFQVHANGLGGSSDLTFRSNVMTSGDSGDSQGIFIRSESAARGNLHSNIVVDNNYYEGNMRNAVAVSDAANVSITGNTVRYAGDAGLVPGIVVGNLANAVVDGNIAPMLLHRNDSVSTGLAWTNNIDLMDHKQQRGVAISELFDSPVHDGSLDYLGLGVRAGSIADTRDVGFRAVGEIGNLSGGAAMLIAAYVPQFGNHFPVDLLV